MTDWWKKAGKAKLQEKAQAIVDAVDQALWEAINQAQNGQGMISDAELHLIAMEIVDANKMAPPPHLLKKFSEQARVDSKKRGHSGYCKTFAKLCIDWALNSQPSAALAEQPVGSIMSNLSPVAQAVLDAAFAVEDEWDTIPMIAAALRAAADQVVPDDKHSSFSPGAPQAFAIQRRTTRSQLLAIADELEGNA